MSYADFQHFAARWGFFYMLAIYALVFAIVLVRPRRLRGQGLGRALGRALGALFLTPGRGGAGFGTALTAAGRRADAALHRFFAGPFAPTPQETQNGAHTDTDRDRS